MNDGRLALVLLLLLLLALLHASAFLVEFPPSTPYAPAVVTNHISSRASRSSTGSAASDGPVSSRFSTNSGTGAISSSGTGGQEQHDPGATFSFSGRATYPKSRYEAYVGFTDTGPAERGRKQRRGQSSSTHQSNHGQLLTRDSSSNHLQLSRRHLHQASAVCPDGCASGFCMPAGNDPLMGFKCQQCLNNLVMDKATGKCACPAGRYSKTANSCTDCPKGHYCDGGVYVSGSTNQPILRACPSNMTTLGLRSQSVRACVNLPGTFYTIDGTSGEVGASVCPVNTYGPGFRKQRACVPCPTNYKTNGLTGRTSPMQCVVPPGYYLKMPGVVAPCPMGEWKDGTGPAGNCTKCPFGVTTPTEGSTSAAACAVLLPGYYAAAMDGSGTVTAAAACPQKYYCPGAVTPGQAFDPSNPSGLSPSEPSIKQCPDGTWTQERAAIAPEQCLTPPGHYTSGGVTQICVNGSFRSDWLPAMMATACTSCGAGVQGDKSDRLTVYDLVTGTAGLLPIMTSASDCFIQAGQGLMYSSMTGAFRARNCEDNTYGVPTRFYGLTPYPCRPCPTGLVASNDSRQYPNSSAWWIDNGDGTRGFFNVKACVTQPGYGYNSRIAQPCAAGTYNRHDTYLPCTACPTGLTTAGVGVGITIANCGMKAGYGFHNGAITLCPVGTYNDAAYTNSTTTPCSSCPNGTTTSSTGGDSAGACSLCAAGYGGAACSSLCGGPGASATYGPAGRTVGSACVSCTTSATGYSFEWNGSNGLFNPQAVSRVGATSSVACLTEFAQFADHAWWLPTTGDTNMVVTGSVVSFSDCVATCTSAAKCQYVTYDYTTQTCYMRWGAAAILAGTPWVGFKAVPSGDVGSAWSIPHLASTGAKAATSGMYSWYQDPNAASIGIQRTATNASSFTVIQDCLDACDDDSLCVGVIMKSASNPVNTPKNCVLIRGDTTLGVFKRSVTRADTARLAIPPL